VVPQAEPTGLGEAYNGFMRQHHRTPGKHLHFDCKGYDLVWRPPLRLDETTPVAPSMDSALDPAHPLERTFSWACDAGAYDGRRRVERHHRTTRQICDRG